MRSGYIIRRNRGGTLYLTEFDDPKLAGTWSEDEEIAWFASTGLHAQEKDDALFLLYKRIDRGVDRWIQDARYIPRLLISALSFLVVYFFFSLAIRDPLPMIDELFIASAAAVITAMGLARRDKKGDVAMKQRLVLKQQASRSDFIIEEGIASYEDYLDECSHLDTIDLAERLTLTTSESLPSLVIPEGRTGPWQEQFNNLLLRSIELTHKQLFTRYRQIIRVRNSEQGDESLAARLVKFSMQGQIDLPLLALLVEVEKQK